MEIRTNPFDWPGFQNFVEKYHRDKIRGLIKEATDNAFGAGSSQVAWTFDERSNSLTVEDWGKGMGDAERRAFFTVFGSTTRTRADAAGQYGIGKGMYMLAGQSMKIHTRTASSYTYMLWERNKPAVHKTSEDGVALDHIGTKFIIHDLNREIRKSITVRLPTAVQMLYSSRLRENVVTFNGVRIAPIVPGVKPRRFRVHVKDVASGRAHDTDLALWWSPTELDPDLQGVGVVLAGVTSFRDKLGLNWEEWDFISGEVQADFLKDYLDVNKSGFINAQLPNDFRSALAKKVMKFRSDHSEKKAPSTGWRSASRMISRIVKILTGRVSEEGEEPVGYVGTESPIDVEKPHRPGPRGKHDYPEVRQPPGGLTVQVRFFGGMPPSIAEKQEDAIIVWADHPAFRRIRVLKADPADPHIAMFSRESSVEYYILIAGMLALLGKEIPMPTTPEALAQQIQKAILAWGEVTKVGRGE